ncbi:MAG: HIT domain-containing protein [Candidatus Nanoarchaeia archaeon]|nr:HIT domain-containing protein [Candidatus Nanoarchaeia archaeon]
MDKRSILFVCTGNIYRSLTAQLAFQKFLNDNNIKNWNVKSAGIKANKEEIHDGVKKTLKKYGFDKINHKQTKLTKKILNEYDCVVAMAQNHVDFIKNELKFNNVLLFNELAIDKKTSILDIEDNVKDYKTNPEAVEKEMEKTIKYIFNNIEKLYKKVLERFYIFCDFIENNISHRNGFPFIKLYETKNAISFMSIDIPQKVDGHILVIPKKRYNDFKKIPLNVLSEIMEIIKKIAIVIERNYGGYNILLNNSTDAGQYIFHTHFHIIPRISNDNIRIELWKRNKITKEDFILLNNKFKKEMEIIDKERN